MLCFRRQNKPRVTIKVFMKVTIMMVQKQCEAITQVGKLSDYGLGWIEEPLRADEGGE